jgi:hypothetical protein
MHRPRTLGRLASLLLLSVCGSACEVEDSVNNVGVVGGTAGQQYAGRVHQGRCPEGDTVMLTLPMAVGRVPGGGVVAETSVCSLPATARNSS